MPSFGAGQSPCPTWGFQGKFGPISGQALGGRPRGDEEQEKALALLCAGQSHPARSAGGFREWRLTLFQTAKSAIDAVPGKTGVFPRR